MPSVNKYQRFILVENQTKPDKPDKMDKKPSHGGQGSGNGKRIAHTP